MPGEVVRLTDLRKEVLMIVVNNQTADAQVTSQADLAIHSALRDFVRIAEPQAFRLDGTINIVDGQRDYSLPGDLMTIIEPGVFYTDGDHRTLQYANEQTVREYEWDRSQRSGEPDFYVLRGKNQYTGDWNVRLYPTPNVDRTLVVHYLGFPLALWPGKPEQSAVDPRLPPEFHHALVCGAVTNLPRYLNLTTDIIPYAQKWAQYLEDAKNYALPVRGQAYQRARYDSYGFMPHPFLWQDPTLNPG